MRRIKGWVWAGLALVLFVGSFALSYARLNLNNTANGSGVGGQNTKRLSSDAFVSLRYILADGRKGGEERLDQVPADLIGASLNDIRKTRPAWSIIRFQVDELVAEVRCEKTSGGYLGTRDGRVAVFEGTPGPCSVLREVTEVPLEQVRIEERTRLEKGLIHFADEDNLQELLDGLVRD